MPKHIRKSRRTVLMIVSGALLAQTPGCQDIVRANLLTGLRDGISAAAGSIVAEALTIKFNLDGDDEGAEEE
ncbi:MAG: hypothetical protein HJJLKODD_01447 [Phycisphaerae bacterium]|nr:hypothetical protein [Phycisphaerae bacterium]